MSLRTRLTVLAAIVFGVALVGAGIVMVGVVEREARASALDAIDAALTERAAVIESGVVESGPNEPESRIAVGDGIEFGIFRRDGAVAFGSMYIDGVEVAIVELNLDTDEVNELLDPETNGTVTDPEVVAAADQLVIATRTVNGEDDRLVVGALSPTSVAVSTAAARRAMWLILPPIWLIAVVITWLMVGRALRPVESVTKQARRISTENLHERVPVPRHRDEIGRLATTLNEMLDRLERGDARQRQFSADVSHELRSPLAAVKVAADVIVEHPERAPAMAPEISAGADRLDRIIDDMLALAALDASTEVASEAVGLGAVVTDSVRALDRGAGREVEVSTSPSAVVVGNDTQLRRAVDNLLSNAIRHASSLVSVTVEMAGDAVNVVVEDDGPGVPDDMTDAVFERFVRLDEARSRDDGGVGLGLSLVEAIVEAHGGTIELDTSTALGGARFTVALPSASN